MRPPEGGHTFSPRRSFTIFLLHCGLDKKRLERACERLDFGVTIHRFPREELFAYRMRLARPRPDLIIIRGHFRSLVAGLNGEKQIPTVVISGHHKRQDCGFHFIQAMHGYAGAEALEVYEHAAMIMRQLLQPPQSPPEISAN